MEKVSKKPTADMQAFMRDVIHESLKDWFKEKWVRINTSGNITGPCGTMKKGKTKTRCLPKAKAQSLTKAQRKATVAKKVKGGKKGKQFVKNTKAAKVKKEEITQLVKETVIEYLLEKNIPTDPAKWAYYKSQAKKKYNVYPSAYANGWAAKEYKAAGGGWKKAPKKKKKANEDTIQELNCKYGEYWCTTDKKHKCRKRPKSTNEVKTVNESFLTIASAWLLKVLPSMLIGMLGGRIINNAVKEFGELKDLEAQEVKNITIYAEKPELIIRDVEDGKVGHSTVEDVIEFIKYLAKEESIDQLEREHHQKVIDTLEQWYDARKELFHKDGTPRKKSQTIEELVDALWIYLPGYIMNSGFQIHARREHRKVVEDNELQQAFGTTTPEGDRFFNAYRNRVLHARSVYLEERPKIRLKKKRKKQYEEKLQLFKQGIAFLKTVIEYTEEVIKDSKSTDKIKAAAKKDLKVLQYRLENAQDFVRRLEEKPLN